MVRERGHKGDIIGTADVVLRRKYQRYVKVNIECLNNNHCRKAGIHMTDVNEQIIKTYFELKGYMVKTNLKYMVHYEKSAGESDIDLAIYHIKKGKKAIVEVKGWHWDNFNKSYFEDYDEDEGPNPIYKFLRKEALEKARNFFKSDDFDKILVISAFAEGQSEECIEIANKKGIDWVIDFNEILDFVIQKVEPNKNYRDDMFLQTVRLLKAYGFLKMDAISK